MPLHLSQSIMQHHTSLITINQSVCAKQSHQATFCFTGKFSVLVVFPSGEVLDTLRQKSDSPSSGPRTRDNNVVVCGHKLDELLVLSHKVMMHCWSGLLQKKTNKLANRIWLTNCFVNLQRSHRLRNVRGVGYRAHCVFAFAHHHSRTYIASPDAKWQSGKSCQLRAALSFPVNRVAKLSTCLQDNTVSCEDCQEERRRRWKDKTVVHCKDNTDRKWIRKLMLNLHDAVKKRDGSVD